MKHGPCGYGVTYSQNISKTFLCLREGSSCQNCLWDTLILIITGRFLLQTGQIFNPVEGRQAFPERDVAPWQHVALKPETYIEQRTVILQGLQRKPLMVNIFHSLFVPNFSCLWFTKIISSWLDWFLERMQKWNCSTAQLQVLQLESSSTGYKYSSKW